MASATVSDTGEFLQRNQRNRNLLSARFKLNAFLLHEKKVSCIDVAEGLIVSACYSGFLYVWDYETFELVEKRRVFSMPWIINSVSIHQGTCMGLSSNTFIEWSLPSLTELFRATIPTFTLTAVFSPSNAYALLLTPSLSGELYSVSCEGPKFLCQYSDQAKSAAFFPDETGFAIGTSHGSILIVSMPDFVLTKILSYASQSVSAISIDSTGTWLVAGDNKGTLVSYFQLELCAYKTGHVGFLLAVEFGTDSVFTTGTDLLIKEWVPSTLTLLRTICGATASIDRLIFAGSHLLSADSNGLILAWNLQVSPSLQYQYVAKMFSVAVTPDSRFVIAGGTDGCLNVWNLQTNELALSTRDGNAAALQIYCAQDSRHIAVRFENYMTIWDLETMTILSTTSFQVLEAAFINPEELLIARYSVFERFWFGTNEFRAVSVPFQVFHLAVEDGKAAISDGNDVLGILALDTGELLEVRRPEAQGILTICLIKGLLVTGSFTGAVRLWTLSGELRSELFVAHLGIVQVRIGDGMLAAIARNSEVYVFDLEEMHYLGILNIESSGPQGVAFDLKRRRLFVVDGATAVKQFRLPKLLY